MQDVTSTLDRSAAGEDEVMFDIVSSPAPPRSDILRLAAGTLAAIRIPGMLSPQRCTEVMVELANCEFDHYDPAQVFPPVAKFGIGISDFYSADGLRQEYWAEAEQAAKNWQALFTDDDPVQAVLDQLARSWDGPVSRATIDGQECFVGVVRQLTGGSRIHYDEIARDYPYLFDTPPIVQFGFNCYLAVPESGGELTVHRRRWLPRDEDHRDGYGWAPRVVAGEPHVTLHPEVGEGIFFDSRNYHRIGANTAGRRVALGFFMGVTAENRLILWS
ncbi:2OG-Fe(II)-dependent halogenase WelO5 family protein [Amycolatopsis panacis]|uniref:Proline hydroxylase n=1 Tax=Amycolatopsis panacis TaxID=2340917 RepID=A0A419HX38_9PSEU|nr:proline hydroxylase [Amycolatopsis panacis]RJQ81622.1 proline hydroxylase [Amycolatopsis panacis]